MAFFNGFDVMRIDTDGIARIITDSVINVTEVGGGSLGTVSIDGFGHVESDELAAAAGTIVEFRHPSYLGRFRRTLAGTEAEATALSANVSPRFIVQDLSPSEIVPQSYEVWLHNEDNADAADIFLGYATAGESGGTTKFRHETAGTGVHYTTYFNPVTTDGTRKYHRYEDSPSVSLFVGSTAPGPGDRALTLIPLFDHVDDETTSGTSEESLMLNTLDAGRFGATGDKVIAEYAGVFAATADDKQIKLNLAGDTIFNSGVLTESGTKWKLTATLQRVDETTLKTVVQFSTSVHFQPQRATPAGLDLTDTLDIDLRADDEVAGGTTAEMAHGVFIPGVIDYITFHGELVTYLGDPVT